MDKTNCKCSDLNRSIVVSILAVCILSISSGASSTTHAQTSPGIMKKITSGAGSLIVLVQPAPYPIIKGVQTNLKVTFDQKASNTVQPHIDYDLTISTICGKRVFQASTLAGHPNQPLHTAEGVVTIPYTFQQADGYVLNATVYGILFSPINPESAKFTMNVT